MIPHQKRETTSITNPFRAPVYYYARTDSALQAARECLAEGCPDGTFIYAGYQTAGRGRIAGRQWLSPAGENLLGTLILKQPASTDFTLRIGLAVSLTLDSFLPSAVRTAVKWPNDILINGKKTAGILCESAGGCLLAGIGINLLQTAFLRSIEYTATSLAMIIGVDKYLFLYCLLKYRNVLPAVIGMKKSAAGSGSVVLRYVLCVDSRKTILSRVFLPASRRTERCVSQKRIRNAGIIQANLSTAKLSIRSIRDTQKINTPTQVLGD